MACRTDVGEERCLQGFGGGKLMGRSHLEDLSVDGRIKLRWIFRNLDGCMDWIDVRWDRDRWRALVNVVINFRVA